MMIKTQLTTLLKLLRPVKVSRPLTRIGDQGDGGYLMCDDLIDIAWCYSPGVGSVSSFEESLFSRYGIRSHLAEANRTVELRPYIATFTPKYLGDKPEKSYMNFQEWFGTTGSASGSEDLILQMDIEGGEYEVLLATDRHILNRFRHIIIEFHNIDYWISPPYFELVIQSFKKLLADFYPVHIHPNNCCGYADLDGVLVPRVFEVSFIRKDRVHPLSYETNFPNPLDSANLPDRPDLTLPSSMHWSPPSIVYKGFEFLPNGKGVVHVGANTGQEREIYDHWGLKVIWFEPIPQVFEQLKSNIADLPLQRAFPFILTDEADTDVELFISNNGGASSSIYDLAEHKQIWPDVFYTASIRLKSWTLNRFFSYESIDSLGYNILVMDTQGSELLVLKGAEEFLYCFDFIKTEAADFEAYKGGCKLADIKEFLEPKGYKEVSRQEFASHTSGGKYYDVLFQRTK